MNFNSRLASSHELHAYPVLMSCVILCWNKSVVSANRRSQNSHWNAWLNFNFSNKSESLASKLRSLSSKPNSACANFKWAKHDVSVLKIRPQIRHLITSANVSSKLFIWLIESIWAILELCCVSIWRDKPDAWTYMRWQTEHTWCAWTIDLLTSLDRLLTSTFWSKTCWITLLFSMYILRNELCSHRKSIIWSSNTNVSRSLYPQMCFSNAVELNVRSQFSHCVSISNTEMSSPIEMDAILSDFVNKREKMKF